MRTRSADLNLNTEYSELSNKRRGTSIYFLAIAPPLRTYLIALRLLLNWPIFILYVLLQVKLWKLLNIPSDIAKIALRHDIPKFQTKTICPNFTVPTFI